MERLMGQSHAAALRLGGKEGRKDLIHLLHGQSHARVTDRERELTVLQLRLHRKLSAGGFDGVEHEIHEHLLQAAHRRTMSESGRLRFAAQAARAC
jgi:hypothetical protein